MEYLYGTGLMFASFLLLAAYRFFVNPNAGSSGFGKAESTALVSTAVMALGIAFVTRKALNDWSLLSFAEMAVMLGVLFFACTAAWRALARRAAPTAEIVEFQGGPSGPKVDRRGRPASGGRMTPAQHKRAA